MEQKPFHPYYDGHGDYIVDKEAEKEEKQSLILMEIFLILLALIFFSMLIAFAGPWPNSLFIGP